VLHDTSCWVLIMFILVLLAWCEEQFTSIAIHEAEKADEIVLRLVEEQKVCGSGFNYSLSHMLLKCCSSFYTSCSSIH